MTAKTEPPSEGSSHRRWVQRRTVIQSVPASDIFEELEVNYYGIDSILRGWMLAIAILPERALFRMFSRRKHSCSLSPCPACMVMVVSLSLSPNPPYPSLQPLSTPVCRPRLLVQRTSMTIAVVATTCTVSINACHMTGCCCCLHIKKRSDLFPVPSHYSRQRNEFPWSQVEFDKSFSFL